MKDIQEINEELSIILDNNNMNEMANIEKCIVVHNDRETGQIGDNLKFAHFHYKNIHFKFKQECPRNVIELRQMIAFESEQTKIKDNELSDLLKILQKKPSNNKRIKADNVYDFVIGTWETLNEREADYMD